MIPTDEQVAFYREHGWFITPEPLFTPDEIEDALYGTERYYAGERDFLLTARLSTFEGWRPEDGEGMRTNDYVCLQNREIAALSHAAKLGAVAARLCGSPELRLWHSQLLYKPPAATAGVIGWHTDKAYWKSCSSTRMLTAWIPLHDCGDERSPLLIVDRSTRESRIDLAGFRASELDPLAEDRVIVPMHLRAGQVSFHHCLAVHGSGPNTGAEPRVSLSVHLQDADNRFVEAPGAAQWHRNNVLCRSIDGTPDYRDPDICPLLWPER